MEMSFGTSKPDLKMFISCYQCCQFHNVVYNDFFKVTVQILWSVGKGSWMVMNSH
jgi:hypothetical protein